MSENNPAIELYKNPRFGLKSISKMKRENKLNNADLDILKKYEPIQITTTKPTKQEHTPIYDVRDDSFQADLIFYEDISKFNRGYKAILTCIEITTRVAYAYPLKSKNTVDMVEAVNKFIKDSGCRFLMTDDGNEFTNGGVQNLFKKYGVKHTVYKSAYKSKRGMSMIERFNRTLRWYITKLISVTDSFNWVDSLDDLIYNYNHTVNAGIGEKPSNVDEKKAHFLRQDAFMKANKLNSKMIPDKRDNKLVEGDYVRIYKPKKLFDKEGTRYTSEIYTIDSIDGFGYRLRDDENKLLKHKYKANDLLRVDGVIRENQNKNEKLRGEVRKDLKDRRYFKRMDIDYNNILNKPRRHEVRERKPVIRLRF